MTDLVPVEALSALVARLFAAAGVPADAAATVAEALVDADLRGLPSHGSHLVPVYVERLRQGSVSPRTDPKVLVDTGAIAVLDAGHALGVLTADHAMSLATAKARDYGIGAVAVRHAFHFGAAGRYARAAAREGFIGVATANTRPMMPAPGGGHPVVGNNPIAVGVPAPRAAAIRSPERGDAGGAAADPDEPLVLDIALSAANIGRIRLAAANGNAIPDGWATDAEGLATTDPVAALAGMLLPAAGHKGFGLALMVDVLAGVLAGGGYGERVNGLYADTALPNECGHFFLALDVAAFGEPDGFATRLADLEASVTAPPYAPGVDRVLLPGQRSARRLRGAAQRGVPVDRGVLARLLALAADLDVPVPEGLPR
ncbi:Ldh family oxidoreductase [Phytohabitans sp. ZYX-F-186]|uniref:Ldh family oxidoreductase n=1 Tax=Phytohabitans maris TaxID=3071409 RepID=A0ABU0ZRC5_9ACTN|nr:Ldh family oxidoreductase [Phytohabitans sp. ZYX-F-186]MDQ7909566.1 Ldh family oxidoreductase [Phytohabitans sp. ZYX-F-186]